MQLLDGKSCAAEIRSELREIVRLRKLENKKVPHLTAIIVGQNGGSISYVNAKVAACEEIGFESTLISFDESISEEDLLNKILEDLVRVGVIKDHNLVDHQMIVMNPAYVHITKESKEVYNNWGKKNNLNGLFSIGRYGSWTYCSIEDNILQSKELSVRLV